MSEGDLLLRIRGCGTRCVDCSSGDASVLVRTSFRNGGSSARVQHLQRSRGTDRTRQRAAISDVHFLHRLLMMLKTLLLLLKMLLLLLSQKSMRKVLLKALLIPRRINDFRRSAETVQGAVDRISVLATRGGRVRSVFGIVTMTVVDSRRCVMLRRRRWRRRGMRKSGRRWHPIDVTRILIGRGSGPGRNLIGGGQSHVGGSQRRAGRRKTRGGGGGGGGRDGGGGRVLGLVGRRRGIA